MTSPTGVDDIDFLATTGEITNSIGMDPFLTHASTNTSTAPTVQTSQTTTRVQNSLKSRFSLRSMKSALSYTHETFPSPSQRAPPAPLAPLASLHSSLPDAYDTYNTYDAYGSNSNSISLAISDDFNPSHPSQASENIQNTSGTLEETCQTSQTLATPPKNTCNTPEGEEKESSDFALDHALERVSPGEHLDDSIPTKLEQIPCETLLTFDTSDLSVRQSLSSRFGSDLDRLDCSVSDQEDLLTRFVIGYRHVEPLATRLDTTQSKFALYLQFHETFDFKHVLTRPDSFLNSKDSNFSTLLRRDLLRACPYFLYGLDRAGHPVLWDDGTGSPRDIHEVFTKSNGDADAWRIGSMRSVLMRRVFNLMRTVSAYYENNIWQQVVVMNLAHLNVMELGEQLHKNRKFHVDAVRSLSDTFPEMVSKIIFINAPFMMRVVWKLIAPLMDAGTHKKVKILGTDFIGELEQYIDKKMIPKKYGGDGKWEIRYGDVPETFPFQTKDELLPLRMKKKDCSKKCVEKVAIEFEGVGEDMQECGREG